MYLIVRGGIVMIGVTLNYWWRLVVLWVHLSCATMGIVFELDLV